DLRAAVFTNALKPSFGSFKTFQRREYRIGLVAGDDAEPGRHQRILGLEFADQRQTDTMTLAAMFDLQDLTEAVARGFEQPDSRSVASASREATSACRCGGAHILSVVVIDVDDGGRALRQQIFEQPQLGGEIGFETRMIVEMVARDIGETRCRNAQAIEPV